MANEQEEKTLTARDYLELLDSIGNKWSALVRHVQQKLNTVWTGIRKMLKDASRSFSLDIIDSFVVDTTAKFKELAVIVGPGLSGALQQVQQDLLSMKAAFIQAAAPLVQALLPLLQQAVGLLTGFAQSMALVLQSLFGGSAAAEQYTGSIQGAVSATASLKRTLAGFDQLQRLAERDTAALAPQAPAITPAWKSFATQLLELLEPLQRFDLSGVSRGLEKLKKALEPITKTLFEGLEWAWHNLFVPMAQWASEELLPAFLQLLNQALQSLNQIIVELKPAFTWLWEEFLQPMAQWYADKLISDIQSMTGRFQDFSQWIQQSMPALNGLLTALKNAGLTLKNLYGNSDLVTGAMGRLGEVIRSFILVTQQTDPAVGILSGGLQLLTPLLSGLTGAWQQVEGATGSAWAAMCETWKNVAGWFRDQVTAPMTQGANGIIGIFNGMFDSIGATFNMLLQLLNSIQITFPDWVPGMGGKSLQLQLPGISLPSIPQLAKGAVLPANKPFLAVVGDQKQGTNVEAPLSTIQEAVQLALEDRLDGVMAGFQTVTRYQEQILQAIFGLDISDGALAAAVKRYNGKMAYMTGGEL